MNEQRNNGRGIFYGVIGVATLVVAIIGATFAYFTASQDIQNAVTGNMATITFDLRITKVTKADEAKGGMIPMSNTMVEAAVKGMGQTAKTDSATYTEQDVTNAGGEDKAGFKAGDLKDPQICVDDNGNAVCQIYKISVVNGGTAGMYLDGYVTLTGGSGIPTDVPVVDGDGDLLVNTQDSKPLKWTNISPVVEGASLVIPTTMRWAQAFCTGTDNQLTSCTTAGSTTTGASGIAAWNAVVNSGDTSGFNTSQIKYTGDSVTAKGTFTGGTTQYDIINTNYIRISDHSAAAAGYTRTNDVTSALVYNQFIAPMGSDGKFTVGTSTDSNEIEADAQVFYIVVWLSETGTNQTAGATSGEGDAATALPGVPDKPGTGFFSGTVTFVSAQGSEVTATFSNYTAVKPDTQKES